MKIIWGMLEPLEEYQILAAKFNKEIQELTNGELEIEIQLFGKDPSNPMKEIEDGNIDIYQIPSTQIRNLMPNHSWLKVWEVPFVFENDKQLETYIESQHTKEKLKSLETDKLLPLTYSYAGGFCGVVSNKKQLNIEAFEKLSNIQFSDYEYEDMSLEDFLIHVYQYLPSNILMYEVNELLKLKPEIKSYLNIDATKHLVVARITMLSKAMISKIPVEYQDLFVNKLNSLLREERQVIYDRSAKNLEALKNDGYIGLEEITTFEEELSEEILFANALM